MNNSQRWIYILLICLLAVAICNAQDKPKSQFPKLLNQGVSTGCDTCKVDWTKYTGTSTAYGSLLTFGKPSPFLMNIMYPDSSGVIRILINPKEIEKRAIWLNDSTLILLKKLK